MSVYSAAPAVCHHEAHLMKAIVIFNDNRNYAFIQSFLFVFVNACWVTFINQNTWGHLSIPSSWLLLKCLVGPSCWIFFHFPYTRLSLDESNINLSAVSPVILLFPFCNQRKEVLLNTAGNNLLKLIISRGGPGRIYECDLRRVWANLWMTALGMAFQRNWDMSWLWHWGQTQHPHPSGSSYPLGLTREHHTNQESDPVQECLFSQHVKSSVMSYSHTQRSPGACYPETLLPASHNQMLCWVFSCWLWSLFQGCFSHFGRGLLQCTRCPEMCNSGDGSGTGQ